MATTPEAFLEWFGKLPRQRFVVETGTHSRWVAHLLKRTGHEVVVGNARKLKLITHNDSKSDKVDARLLSKLGCHGVEWLHPVYVRSQEHQAHLAVIKESAREPGGDAQQASEPAAGTGEGVRIAVACMRCATVSAARRQRDSGGAANSGGWWNKIRQSQYGEATGRLRRIKGVGPLTALVFVLTIEDPSRFRHSRDVGPYLGLTPRKRQSGKRDPQCGITHAGDELMRKLLVNCAQHLLGPFGVESDLRRWGLELVANSAQAGQRGGRKRAATGVARELAVLMHRMWVSGEEFQPQRKAAPAEV